MKDTNLHPAGLLQPLPIPDHVFEDIAVDFITFLPCSKGKTTMLTLEERVTMYCHFISLPSPFSTELVAEAFTVGVILLHGCTRNNVIDRYPQFPHFFWHQLNHSRGLTTLVMRSRYNPQTDGQS